MVKETMSHKMSMEFLGYIHAWEIEHRLPTAAISFCLISFNAAASGLGFIFFSP